MTGILINENIVVLAVQLNNLKYIKENSMNQITYDAALLKKFPINTYVKWSGLTTDTLYVGVVKGLRVNTSNEVVLMIEDYDGDVRNIHASYVEIL